MFSRLRNNAAAAHIAPLAVFMIFTALAGAIAVKNSALPWWRSSPEHWIYPVQTIVCGALIAFFWRRYTFKPARGLVLAAVLGLVTIAIWILPAHFYYAWRDHDSHASDAIPLIGYCLREEGFDPTIFGEGGIAFFVVIALRFARMVLVVPFVEEVFWRGFLMRWLVAGDEKPFTSVAVGAHSWKAFFVTTGAVMLIHAKEDWLGALVFGSAMYWLCVRTGSLAACVWMHAVANLVLGIYVLKTRHWGFW